MRSKPHHYTRNMAVVVEVNFLDKQQETAKHVVRNNVWWSDHLANVITEAEHSMANDEACSAIVLALGAPLGSAYVSALQGRVFPARLQEHLQHAGHGLRSSCVINNHCDVLTLADYIAAARNGKDDLIIYARLKKVFGGVSVATSSLVEVMGKSLGRHPIASEGVERLETFFQKVIKPALHPAIIAHWTWADVIMVALIITTSILWEQRLVRLYPDNVFFTMRLLTSIGRHVMEAHHVTDPDKSVYDIDPLMTYSALHLITAVV